ncbi:hypothetical protein OESDEN_16272 [Oesophagostomum dentatum]|uniref:Uncharacterized protein n=1 Tax=Oesophagostomum dentatum TaxID=61180 RepID=A0A0B1SFC1_OESDE|nr:hypothetical protein OESDEN_16272 [Oesophagostomum dentatum]
MAPSKRSTDKDIDSPPAWLEEMLKRWDSYIERTVQEKSCKITWVGIGERENMQSTIAFDREAVKEIIETSGDEDLLSEWNNKKIDIRRYPESQSSPSENSADPNPTPHFVLPRRNSVQSQQQVCRSMKNGTTDDHSSLNR